MYYSDLVAASEIDNSSRNFCCLVDAAVMLYEQEISNCHTKTTRKTLSAKEEDDEKERDKRIFHLLPRKSRTSVKKFVSPQQYHHNLNGASTSSSRNPLHCPSSYTIPAVDSENTDMTNPRNNPNPHMSSCVTEKKTGRKRRAVEDKKPCGKSKKAKVAATFSWIGKETPESLTQLMNETAIRWGERTDLRLIFERELFTTDVNPSQSRLSMPFNELIRNDFLTPVEISIIEADINNDKKTGIGAVFFDPRNVMWGVMLKRWEMKKDSGKGSWNYALNCGWNNVVKANGLKQGDSISIWSFRWGGLLCFALVTPPPSLALCL